MNLSVGFSSAVQSYNRIYAHSFFNITPVMTRLKSPCANGCFHRNRVFSSPISYDLNSQAARDRHHLNIEESTQTFAWCSRTMQARCTTYSILLHSMPFSDRHLRSLKPILSYVFWYWWWIINKWALKAIRLSKTLHYMYFSHSKTICFGWRLALRHYKYCSRSKRHWSLSWRRWSSSARDSTGGWSLFSYWVRRI